MQIEEQEIDDVTVQEAIGEIAEDPGQEQTESDPSPRITRFAAQEQNGHYNERDTGKRDEETVVVPERAEGRAGVRDVDESKKIGNDNVRIGRIDEAKDETLRDLIEGVERQGEEREKSSSLGELIFRGAHAPRVQRSAPRRTGEAFDIASWFLSAPRCSGGAPQTSTRGACAPRSWQQTHASFRFHDRGAAIAQIRMRGDFADRRPMAPATRALLVRRLADRGAGSCAGFKREIAQDKEFLELLARRIAATTLVATRTTAASSALPISFSWRAFSTA